MRRRIAAAALLACVLRAPALDAQARPREISPIVRYGKWVATAFALGATVVGVREHDEADQAFDRLRGYCGFQGSCALGADGRYQDPGAERLYRSVVDGDRAARTWLAAGQVALVGGVILFVMDLRSRGGPANEPFGGLRVEPAAGGLRLGWRLSFPRPPR